MNDEINSYQASKWIGRRLGTLFAISILANIVLLYRLVQVSQPPQAEEAPLAVEEETPATIAVEAELRMAKMMLGQWDGTVIDHWPGRG
jgi:hypothetical protein